MDTNEGQQAAPRTPHHNFERRPDGQLRTFVPSLCCDHHWSVPVDEPEADEPSVCARCLATCVRDADGTIVDYDCSRLARELEGRPGDRRRR